MLGAFITSRGPYAPESSQALLDKEGELHAFPAVEKWETAKAEPGESTFSAWDRACDLLKGGERLLRNDDAIESGEERRLIELGVPELDVVTIERRGKQKYVELTGDLARVFDGLF